MRYNELISMFFWGIVVKLTSTWINFAASLKHKRHYFFVTNLIGCLHAIVKDPKLRGVSRKIRWSSWLAGKFMIPAHLQGD
jgi:hypothetical protein